MICRKTGSINILLASFFLVISCNRKKSNSISYYNNVNRIDSIYRIAGNSQLAVTEYKKLFEKYDPKNQEQIEEYETYIKLAKKYNVNFGGKESLYKLIDLLSSSGNKYKSYLPLFKKYGIDSTEVQQKIMNWKKSLDKTLIDSLTVASSRDHKGGRRDTIVMRKNDNKNLNLFLQIFEQYGFPSEQRVGGTGINGEPLIIITILSHLICLDYHKIYPKLNEYLNEGDISPRMYALIIDKYYLCQKDQGYYNIYSESVSKEDSVIINRRRKSIGLPSLTHYATIRKDYLNKK